MPTLRVLAGDDSGVALPLHESCAFRTLRLFGIYMARSSPGLALTSVRPLAVRVVFFFFALTILSGGGWSVFGRDGLMLPSVAIVIPARGPPSSGLGGEGEAAARSAAGGGVAAMF
jgi:hypothetical protein